MYPVDIAFRVSIACGSGRVCLPQMTRPLLAGGTDLGYTQSQTAIVRLDGFLEYKKQVEES